MWCLTPICLPAGFQLQQIRQHATRLPWKPICEWNISWNNPPPPHTNTHTQLHTRRPAKKTNTKRRDVTENCLGQLHEQTLTYNFCHFYICTSTHSHTYERSIAVLCIWSFKFSRTVNYVVFHQEILRLPAWRVWEAPWGELQLFINSE